MNTLHKFAVLTLSAVLTVCLLAGCGASASSTASSAASSVASSAHRLQIGQTAHGLLAHHWAVFSGLYGLCFGGLCAAVYLFAKTPAFALSWWLSGLSYDALHGVAQSRLQLLPD